MRFICHILKKQKKKLYNRISRISGQVNSIKDSLGDENYEFKDPYELVHKLASVKGGSAFNDD